MTAFPQDSELHFTVRQELSVQDLHKIAHFAAQFGVEFIGDLPEVPNPVTFKELAEASPVLSLDSYLGKEHFQAYGERAGVYPKTSSSLFRLFVEPRMAPTRQPINIVGVLAVPREEAHLEPLPKHLWTFNSATPETDRLNTHAVLAQSVIELAAQDHRFKGIGGPGYGVAARNALQSIAGRVRSDIATNQTKSYVA